MTGMKAQLHRICAFFPEEPLHKHCRPGNRVLGSIFRYRPSDRDGRAQHMSKAGAHKYILSAMRIENDMRKMLQIRLKPTNENPVGHDALTGKSYDCNLISSQSCQRKLSVLIRRDRRHDHLPLIAADSQPRPMPRIESAIRQIAR